MSLARSIPLVVWLAALCGMCAAASSSAQELEETAGEIRQRRLAYLTELRDLLPSSPPWEEWLQRTGEWPPDFDALTPRPFPPDPLHFARGGAVSQEDWPRRRRELLSLFQYFALGTFPPPPGPVEISSLRSREETGALIDELTLRFGPDLAAGLAVELIIPKNKSTPLPVLIVPSEQRFWAQAAVNRGYIACVVTLPDPDQVHRPWTEIWPQLDWTGPTRNAWAIGRCLDYLHGLPVVNTNQIALAGHAAHGQSALIAAALDRRIGALILSASGPGGPSPWRFATETPFGADLEWFTRHHPHRLHPRMRFFAGREHLLPIDQHQLLACVAPRPSLISSSRHDPDANLWALEHSYREARGVYELFGQGHELNLHYRQDGSEIGPRVLETYFDWLDTVFGRGYFPFPDVAVFPTYQTWRELAEPDIAWSLFPTNKANDLLRNADGTDITTVDQWRVKRSDIRDRVFAALGTAPPYTETKAASAFAHSMPAHRAMLLRRFLVPEGLTKQSVAFGGGLQGDLYLPARSPASTNGFPCVIWLHPVSPALGYVADYTEGDPPHLAVARAGFAVLGFDQIGAGSRLEEIRYFYHRYPRWSLLGKQVDDTLAGFAALLKLPSIDPNRIYAMGYGMGGQVALHAAALEPRLAGVVSVAGFQPMRADREESRTGFVARWSRWYPLLPELGEFAGREERIPYDYHELLGLIAPRPALIFQPRHDHQCRLPILRDSVKEAAKVYERLDRTSNLRLIEWPGYRRFSPEAQVFVIGWLQRAAGLPSPPPPIR